MKWRPWHKVTHHAEQIREAERRARSIEERAARLERVVHEDQWTKGILGSMRRPRGGSR